MNLVEKLIEAVKVKRRMIVVVGDVMLDRWVHGHTAPSQEVCPKFVQDFVVDRPGGAANSEQCLSNWAVSTQLCGHWVSKCGVKTRFVDQGKVVFRHDRDEFAGVSYDLGRINATEWVGCADGVLLSDYDKGFLTTELIQRIVEVCGQRNVPCVADVKRGPEVYQRCITKANEDWYLKHGIASVVTRGADSPIVSGRISHRLPPVACVNHVGAGDCFAAHLTLALAYGFTLEDAATIAHSAGRVYVQHHHNYSLLPQEIVADLNLAQ